MQHQKLLHRYLKRKPEVCLEGSMLVYLEYQNKTTSIEVSKQNVTTLLGYSDINMPGQVIHWSIKATKCKKLIHSRKI
jgi:hypothetical protein